MGIIQAPDSGASICVGHTIEPLTMLNRNHFGLDVEDKPSAIARVNLELPSGEPGNVRWESL